MTPSQDGAWVNPPRAPWINPEMVAQSLAVTLDGEYDDGLEASVSARVKGPTIALELTGDSGEFARFRITVEEVP